jgi:putative endonuclease
VNTVAKGRVGEQKAAEYLHEKGYTILEKNFRTHGGEVDIICIDDTTVVFCEVKAWDSIGREGLEHAVDRRKMGKLMRVADVFLARSPRLQNHTIRFDLVFISAHDGIRHLENITA